MASSRCYLATAVPVSGRYHTVDAAGLLWSLHPALVTSGVNPLDGSVRDLAVRLQVLTGGHGYFGLPPYYPFFTDLDLGGTMQADALATEQFWTRMIASLNQLWPAGPGQRTGGTTRPCLLHARTAGRCGDIRVSYRDSPIHRLAVRTGRLIGCAD